MNTHETEKSVPVETDQSHPAHVLPPEHFAPPSPKKPGRLPSKKLALILSAVAVILIGTGVYSFALKKDDEPAQTAVKLTKDAVPAKDEPAVDEYQKQLADCVKPGAENLAVTWSGQRQKLADLKLIAYSSDINDPPPESQYFKVGTTKSGQAVILIKFNSGTIEETEGIAIEDSAGHYLILSRLQPEFSRHVDSASIYKYGADTKVDNSKVIPELCIGELSYKGQTMKADGLPYDSLLSKVDYNNGSKLLQKYSFGDLYDYYYKNAPEYYMSNLLLLTKDLRQQQFELPAVIKADQSNKYIPNITWTDNTKNTAEYTTKFRGCGSSGSIEVAKDLQASDMVKAGTADGTASVYTLASTGSPLFKVHYTEYKEDAESGAFDYGDNPTPKNLSAEAYLKTRPIILVKDQLGRIIVYVNGKYNTGGGCGKPVIYLYPKQATKVSVKVDAAVVKSLPAYGSGWTDVLAQPSGILNVAGKQYGSLFWEGYGRGTYPDVSGTGTLVARADLQNILPAQLTQLGLNPTEKAEFMDFWWPKMPVTPYIKLTWLGTKQMDALAPLTVTPKPDTTIRVFLDFEGLSSPVNLRPQRLSSVPRKGFTLVEWGGLLREGIR